MKKLTIEKMKPIAERVLAIFENEFSYNGYLNGPEMEEYILSSNVDYELRKMFPRGYTYRYGISKFVILPRGYNWVIKLPLFCDGETIYDDWYDSCRNIYHSHSIVMDERHDFDGAWLPFTGECSSNYCEMEAQLSTIAMNCGIGSMIAKTYRITDLVYVSERIKETYMDMEDYDTSHPYRDTFRSKYHYQKSIDAGDRYERVIGNLPDYEDFWGDVIIQNGDQKYDELLKFINDYGVNDLHSSNIGYTFDGKAVIIDMGFND